MERKNSGVISMSELNLNKLKKWEEEEYSKIRFDLKRLLESHKMNPKDLHLDFIVVAIQNGELLESNNKLNSQLEKVVKELDELKKEREEKVFRKEARANINYSTFETSRYYFNLFCKNRKS